ncbi:MAG: hypothetical protein GF400_03780 [Candidatus Eisenbacteria bacterium]|nr:hypothetical protein [Candidatus Eisenbacteria bacterium]
MDGRPAAGLLACLLLLAAVEVTCAAAPAAGEPGGTVSLSRGRRSVSVPGSEAGEVVPLPDRLVVAGSDSVWVDARLLERDLDYRLLFDPARVSLEAAPPETSVVTITYLYLPFDLQTSYSHAVLDSFARAPDWMEGGARLVETGGTESRELPAGLNVGGAKTFGVKVGSDRDPTLEQSLRLNVNGRITPDLRINAYLSDQNTPLVPEGDTEELRALDKVLLEIEGESVSARMGDVELAMSGGRLFDVRRDLKGAVGEAVIGRGELKLAGAAADGEFATDTFRGQGGKQGPYLLGTSVGAAGVQVVAGSENVWIDGERMRRGRDNDYVIDYAAGELTFTERRQITTDNVISVDYEYSLSDFERDLYAGRGTLGIGESARVGVSFFREADDEGSPISLALSEEQLAILASAGDDEGLAHDDGVDSVGVGGDYVKAEEGYFVYAGADSGVYDLHFERRKSGDYDYDFEGDRYVYVGEGEGEYSLGRSLPLPSDLIFGAVDAAVPLGREGSLDMEAAVSSLDENTLSDLDDDDNLGSAQALSVELPKIPLRADGESSLGFEMDARRVAGAFRGVGRYRDVIYLEKWELEGLELPVSELLLDGSVTAADEQLGRLALSYGYLERGESVSARKAELALEARPTDDTRLSADGRLVELDATEESREREFLRADLRHDLGPVAPGASYRHDSRVSDGVSGERYDEYGMSLDRRGGAFGFGARYAHRLTDRRDETGWRRASVTRTQEYSVDLRGTELLSLEATASRRVTDFEPEFEDAGSKHDVARIRAMHRSAGGALRGEVRYSVTSTEVEEKLRQVIVEDGVEIVRIRSTGVYYPVTELSASTGWEWSPRGGVGRRGDLPDPSAFRRFLSTLSLETDIRLTETTETGEKRRLYLLDPGIIRGDDTVRGELTGRHVARYVARDGSRSLRLALTTRDALDRSYLESTELRKERTGTADFKLSPSGDVAYRVQGDLGSRTQTSEGTGYSYEIDERSALAEVTVRRLGDVELGLLGSLKGTEERLDGVSLTETVITPSIKYRLRGKGTVTASLSRVDVSTDVETLPFYLAAGRRPGVTTEWRLLADYRLNRYLTASVSYTGEKRPDSDARHTLDARVNAFF